MITDEQFEQRAHEVAIELIVGDLLLRIGFAIMRWHDGYIPRNALQMAQARRYMQFRWN